MLIRAMKVASALEHPKADALRIYRFRAPNMEGEIQVVANLENVYQPGDVVAVACVGATLTDGTKIKKARLRGVDSFGMALGPVEAEPGDDLTERFGQPDTSAASDSASFIKWPSIELLHNVRRGIEAQQEVMGDGGASQKVVYRAKVKLDGTNAGVQLLPEGGVVAQSRTQLLQGGVDNLGFAAWVETNRAFFSDLARALGHAVIFGEWCGEGIQKRTAISRIGRKVFVVFALQRGDHARVESHLEVRPERLRELLPEHPEIFVLPWYSEPMELDFGDVDALRAAAERINTMVSEVEAVDPWVKEIFGIEGVGEGLVFYPDPDAPRGADRHSVSELIFKAKGEKHQVVRQKKPAQLDPEVARNIESFAEMVTTEARLEQALREGCGGTLEMRQMGGFLKWINQDVAKECVAELEASGLTWKQVNKAVTTRARTWFQDKVRAL